MGGGCYYCLTRPILDLIKFYRVVQTSLLLLRLRLRFSWRGGKIVFLFGRCFGLSLCLGLVLYCCWRLLMIKVSLRKSVCVYKELCQFPISHIISIYHDTMIHCAISHRLCILYLFNSSSFLWVECVIIINMFSHWNNLVLGILIVQHCTALCGYYGYKSLLEECKKNQRTVSLL